MADAKRSYSKGSLFRFRFEWVWALLVAKPKIGGVRSQLYYREGFEKNDSMILHSKKRGRVYYDNAILIPGGGGDYFFQKIHRKIDFLTQADF